MADTSNPGYLAEDESQLTRMVCPECGGALAQLNLPQIAYFRCHTGHQYAPQTLAAAQAETAEAKLWSAVAALEEQAAMLHYLHDGDAGLADTEGYADQISERAATLRQQAQHWSAPVTGQPEELPD